MKLEPITHQNTIKRRVAGEPTQIKTFNLDAKINIC